MNKGKNILEHHNDINNHMYDVLAKRFFMIASSDIQGPKDDIDFLTKISGSLGHLSHVSVGIEKTFKHEKRLKAIEDKLKTNFATSMRMFEEPQMEKYR